MKVISNVGRLYSSTLKETLERSSLVCTVNIPLRHAEGSTNSAVNEPKSFVCTFLVASSLWLVSNRAIS